MGDDTVLRQHALIPLPVRRGREGSHRSTLRRGAAWARVDSERSGRRARTMERTAGRRPGRSFPKTQEYLGKFVEQPPPRDSNCLQKIDSNKNYSA
jgi:hypothetical protein